MAFRSGSLPLRLATFACTLWVSACSEGSGDAQIPPSGSPLGKGYHLRDLQDPAAKNRPAPGTPVEMTGLSVVHVDTFDETRNGKSIGTIYVQDYGSKAPYSGIGTYQPSFVPQSLRTFPGDVLDFRGEYQENKTIDKVVFPAGHLLPQLFRPVGSFRFEAAPVEPTEIPAADLRSFDTGRKWIGMLVRVRDVQVDGFRESKGRVSGPLLPLDPDDDRNGPAITNELFDLPPNAYGSRPRFASVTGIVTYFFNLHVAPRSAADLVPAP